MVNNNKNVNNMNNNKNKSAENKNFSNKKGNTIKGNTTIMILAAAVVLFLVGVVLWQQSQLSSLKKQVQNQPEEEQTQGQGQQEEEQGQGQQEEEEEEQNGGETEETSVPEDWKRFNGSVYLFFYPESLDYNFINTEEWPPDVTIKSGDAFNCKNRSLKTEFGYGEQKIEGDNCFTVLNQGTAGTTYKKYIYSGIIANDLVEMSFVLSFPNCGVLSDIDACKAEQEGFDTKNLADKMFSTLIFEESQVTNMRELFGIELNNIDYNQVVENNMTIRGEAKGVWFFEGDFPIYLRDNNNNLISTAIAKAQKEWMTTDFVPFEASLVFESTPTTKSGILVFERSNPKGDEARETLEILIRFLE